jgi:two-component sensor histidine kinase
MDYWIGRLREQAAQIAGGNYQQGLNTFARAPDGLAELSRDLDDLALVMAEREVVRKALALEVHHRVKNNLQIVTSLLNMQASRIENPAAREALGQTRARIGALALIHRILYEHDDDSSQATIEIARLISELCAQFRMWNCNRREIVFSCESSAVAVPLDSAMPLALFAVEAVTNAYAYGFPEGRAGTVALHFIVNGEDDAVLSVTDNGIGFDIASNDQSMGRQLMNGFAQQLGGEISIVSSPETGTDVRLEYRLRP